MNVTFRVLPVFAALAVLLTGPEAFAGCQTAGSSAEDASSEDAAGTRLLVRFEEGLSEDEIASINRRLGATVVNRMRGGKLLLVEIPYADTRSQIIEAYSATEGVVYAEPDQPVSIPTPPGEADDPPRGGGDDPDDGSSPVIELPQVD